MPSISRPSALRSETADLRSRSEQLRECSRDLQRRSQDCRQRVAHAIAALHAPEPASDRENTYLKRLRRAEADLEGAIAECRVALDEVRRELAWCDAVPRPVVH